MMKRRLLIVFATALLASSFTQISRAQAPGEVCLNGDNQVVLIPVGNLVHLNCTHIGSRWIWVNEDGDLRAKATALPQAISGHQYGTNVSPIGGSPPYGCALAPASVLPHGFALALCQIVATPVPLLASGSTKSISQNFTIIYTDSANPPVRIQSTYHIEIVTEAPTIILPPGATCTVNRRCSALIAQGAGGVPPYHFQSDTLRTGVLPWGTVVGVNGLLIGIPTRAGNYVFGVCVVDVVATEKCGMTGAQILPEKKTSTPIPTPTEKGNTATAYDGTYNGVFEVSYSSSSMPVAGQKLTGISFKIGNGKFTGDITGTADFGEDNLPNHAYGATLKMNLLGFSCYIGNGIDFTVPRGASQYKSTLVDCDDGTHHVQGYVSGSKLG